MDSIESKQQYRPIPEGNDVVVIGSGLGGLIAALELARHGLKVCVLEQHRVAGGYAHAFRRSGFHFDISLHSMGGLSEGSLTQSVLHGLGVYDKLSLKRCGTLFTADYPELSVVVPNHPGGAFEMLSRLFPREQKGLVSLFDLLVRLKRDVTDPNIFDEGEPMPGNRLSEGYLDRTFGDLIRDHVSDPRLLALLGQLWMQVGLPPQLSTATFSTCVFCSTFVEGAYYIMGGGPALVRAMVERLRELGGECLTRTPVERIVTEGKTASGVRLESGEFVPAKVVISNASPIHTFFDLLPGDEISQIYRYRLRQMEPSLSLYALYLGIDCPPSSFGVPLDNYYFNYQFDHQQAYDRLMAHDIDRTDWVLTNYEAEVTASYPKGSGMLSFAELTPSADWLDLDPEAYQAKKEAVLDRLLIKYVKRFPRLDEHIDVMEFATPRTMHRFTRNHRGAIYGFAQTVGQSNSRRLRNRTPVNRLFLTGAWTWAGGGYEGAMMTGVQTARAVLREIEAPRKAPPLRRFAPESAEDAALAEEKRRSEIRRRFENRLAAEQRRTPGGPELDDRYYRYRQPVNVYGEDLNSQGYADINAFLRYIDRARVEAIEELCRESRRPSWLERYVVNVYSIDIELTGTPGFGAPLEVRTGLQKISSHRGRFDQKIVDGVTGHLVADAEVEVLFLDDAMNLVEVPDELPVFDRSGAIDGKDRRSVIPFSDEDRFPFRARFRVYYEDTDTQGITYHVSYVRFCNRALFDLVRTVWPETPGKTWMAKNKVSVSRTTVRYLKSSGLGDRLEVRTGLKTLSTHGVLFCQRIVHAETLDVLADVTTEVIFRDENNQPVPIPAEVLDAGLSALPVEGGDEV